VEALAIDDINKKAPYRVLFREDRPCNFYFITDYKVEYSISFCMDYSIIPSGAYALDITNAKHKASPNDIKFRQTLVAIIEEFFEKNNDVMLYITETGDEKQSSRNRLFVRWFNTYEHKERYVIHTAEGELEGQMNFLAFFSRRDNPHLLQYLEEFNETIELLFN